MWRREEASADEDEALGMIRSWWRLCLPCSSASLTSYVFLSESSRYVSSKMLPFLPAARLSAPFRREAAVRLRKGRSEGVADSREKVVGVRGLASRGERGGRSGVPRESSTGVRRSVWLDLNAVERRSRVVDAKVLIWCQQDRQRSSWGSAGRTYWGWSHASPSARPAARPASQPAP